MVWFCNQKDINCHTINAELEISCRECKRPRMNDVILCNICEVQFESYLAVENHTKKEHGDVK